MPIARPEREKQRDKSVSTYISQDFIHCAPLLRKNRSTSEQLIQSFCSKQSNADYGAFDDYTCSAYCSFQRGTGCVFSIIKSNVSPFFFFVVSKLRSMKNRGNRTFECK